MVNKMNLTGLTTKDITKDFIKENFDLDAERKDKKVTYEEIYCSETIYDYVDFEKSWFGFVNLLDEARKNAIARGFDIYDIRVSIRTHDGYTGCSCCSESSYSELIVYAKDCYRKETDDEVIARLRRKIKKQVKENEK